MNLILLGAPGSGKGTQAEKMVEKLKVPSVSTGEILREAIKNKTELGLTAKKYMDEGKLVPDEVVIGIVKARLAQDDCSQGCILDGFPRTVEQAEALAEITHEMGRKIDAVINLKVDEEEIIDRLIKRKRADDNIETITERLKVYQNQTSPLVTYYSEKGLLKDVVGTGGVEDIFNRIIDVISAN